MKEIGHQGFSKEYWIENYSEPQTMDGIGNAKEHARYLKNLLSIDMIDVSSVIDLGCGLGYLFKEMLRTFVPYKAIAIEPSEFAYQKLLKKKLKPVDSTNLKIMKTDIVSWCRDNKFDKKTFDLGLCTSVLQYLTDEELKFALPILAQRVRYLYLTVPTEVELKRIHEELDFDDPYAFRRSRDWYQKMISPYFTFISSRVLESKAHFDENNTLFSDLLFRH